MTAKEEAAKLVGWLRDLSHCMPAWDGDTLVGDDQVADDAADLIESQQQRITELEDAGLGADGTWFMDMAVGSIRMAESKTSDRLRERIESLEQQLATEVKLYWEAEGATARLIERVDALTEQLAQRDAIIERVREARGNHPQCDRHKAADPVACGWKRTVQDIDVALSAAPVLAARDAKVKTQAVHEAAEVVRRHATPPGELANPKSDALIAWVADWMENPPSWVQVSYRKGADHAE